jgi:Glycosyl transferase family 2
MIVRDYCAPLAGSRSHSKTHPGFIGVSGYLCMNEEFQNSVLERLRAVETRIAQLEGRMDFATRAYSRARHQLRRIWLRPPLWKFEQYSPRPIDLGSPKRPERLPNALPRIAIVTPSYNHRKYVQATIDSVLAQEYPNLFYHVQDGASTDGTIDLLKTYGDRIVWRSEGDSGQAQAINRGFAGVDCDIMAYLNSDDTLMPGTLAYVAGIFHVRPDVDIVYGHRVFINSDGLEVGRAVLPSHHAQTLMWADYVPQETLFWRRRVWDAVGPIDESFHYALDWEFILRVQAAGFKFMRLPRFLACFRVHDEQKTAALYDVGRQEMQTLRKRYLGCEPTQSQIYRAAFPYLARRVFAQPARACRRHGGSGAVVPLARLDRRPAIYDIPG